MYPYESLDLDQELHEGYSRVEAAFKLWRDHQIFPSSAIDFTTGVGFHISVGIRRSVFFGCDIEERMYDSQIWLPLERMEYVGLIRDLPLEPVNDVVFFKARRIFTKETQRFIAELITSDFRIELPRSALVHLRSDWLDR